MVECKECGWDVPKKEESSVYPLCEDCLEHLETLEPGQTPNYGLIVLGIEND